MTCPLALRTNYLLRSTGPTTTTTTGLSRRLDGALSHDHITRWLSQGPYGPAAVWRQAKPLIRQAEAQRPGDEFAVLLVGNPVLKKAHTDAKELLCTHWDHRQQRYAKGLNFVDLRYQTGALALPIAVGARRAAGGGAHPVRLARHAAKPHPHVAGGPLQFPRPGSASGITGRNARF